MADGRTTLEQPMSTMLAPGEELLGGCKAAGKNAVIKTSVGGVAGALIAGGRRSGGIGDVVPQDKVFWIGATNQRLVYFGVGALTSKPKDFRGETPLAAVVGVEVSRNKIFRRLAIGFADGSSAVVDLYRANSPDSLQTALEQVLPGKVVEVK